MWGTTYKCFIYGTIFIEKLSPQGGTHFIFICIIIPPLSLGWFWILPCHQKDYHPCWTNPKGSLYRNSRTTLWGILVIAWISENFAQNIPSPFSHVKLHFAQFPSHARGVRVTTYYRYIETLLWFILKRVGSIDSLYNTVYLPFFLFWSQIKYITKIGSLEANIQKVSLGLIKKCMSASSQVCH